MSIYLHEKSLTSIAATIIMVSTVHRSLRNIKANIFETGIHEEMLVSTMVHCQSAVTHTPTER